jgi:hypothetical protein
MIAGKHKHNMVIKYKLQVSTLLLGSGVNGEQQAGKNKKTSVYAMGLPPAPYDDNLVIKSKINGLHNE